MRSGIEHPVRPASAAAVLDLLAAATTRRVRDLGVTLTAFWGTVIAVAGGSAIALLGRPADSGSYFSWDLGAPSAAATIGGLYLASVAAFGAALLSSRARVRSLSIGVLALALPTLWFTWIHRDVFDWNRPQAVAWVFLFLSAPAAIIDDLRTPAGADPSPPAGRGTRAALAVVAIVGAIGAASLWIEPLVSHVAARSPVPPVGLTGRYLGAWCAFLSTTTASAAVRGRTSDARLAAVLLGSVSVGVLVAALRTIDDLGPNAVPYVAAVATIGVGAVVIHRTNRVPAAPAAGDHPLSCEMEDDTTNTHATTDERARS